MRPSVHHAIREYYEAPAVRRRLAEYCGGLPDPPTAFSCLELAAYGGCRGRIEADGGPTPLSNAGHARAAALAGTRVLEP